MLRLLKQCLALFVLAFAITGCGGSGGKDGSAFQHDKAQTLFLEAIKARPTDQAKALDLLSQSIDTKPSYIAHFHRAWLYALKGEDEKANEDVKAGLAMEPADADLKWLEGEMKKPAKQRKLDMPPPKKK